MLYNIIMFSNSFSRLSLRFFPVPKFLVEPSFGLDISDESIKFIELVNTRDGIKVGRHGERNIPPGVIELGKIKNQNKVEEILFSLRKEEGLKAVRVSLLEEQVYLYKFRLEKAGLVNVRESIELSLEEHVPLSAEEAIFDYELIREDEESLELQIAAVPKNVIESYLTIFANSGIKVQSLELEALGSLCLL